MSNSSLHDPASAAHTAAAPRRLLICGGAAATAFVAQGFARTIYDARTATLDSAADVARDLAPEFVMIELPADDAEAEAGLTLARRLRGDAATHAVPLVLLHRRDDPSLRRQALALGADDYFAATAAPEEMRSRLDALAWRAAVGRRAAPDAPDRRAEIDDFLGLVDLVRADIKTGAAGSLALVELSRGDATTRTENPIARAHGFFKLRLRRLDSVAFYGPTTVLVYLPGLAAPRARADLARLRDEFRADDSAASLLLGVASFPADGAEVEDLIERAESRLSVSDDIEAEALAPVAPDDASHAGAFVSASFGAHASNGNGANGSHAREAHAADRRKADRRKADRHAARQTTAPSLVTTTPETTPADRKQTAAAYDPVLARMNRDHEALSRPAARAAEEERQLRAQGVAMPRRALIAVSDPARLAQLNALVRSAGYEVRTAFAGQQALDLTRIERFDVLLVDHRLYGFDGLEVIRRLRRHERGRQPLPVVLTVETDDAMTRGETDALGGAHIVTLPYEPADLLRRLRAVGRINED